MLVREYFEQLYAHGVRGFDWEDCWRGYRRQSFLGLLMTVGPAVIVERTERGDDMFLTSARALRPAGPRPRCARAAAGTRIGPSGAAPGPGDEGVTPPAREELWNESWYFDAVSDDARAGRYARLGLYPNLGVSWLTALVCGPTPPRWRSSTSRRPCRRAMTDRGHRETGFS